MAVKPKSPFLVIEEFVSPLTCEEIVDTIGAGWPDTDTQGKPLMTGFRNRLVELRLSETLSDLLPSIDAYYGTKIKGISPFEIEWYPQRCKQAAPRCENSIYMNGKWTRSNNRDFVAILFLTDYQDKAPFDPDFEVKGGKLQFPNHGFGFNPRRGMLVIFPGSPNFVNVTGRIDVGNLFQIRIPFTATVPYVYDMQKFPGNYEVWFM